MSGVALQTSLVRLASPGPLLLRRLARRRLVVISLFTC